MLSDRLLNRVPRNHIRRRNPADRIKPQYRKDRSRLSLRDRLRIYRSIGLQPKDSRAGKHRNSGPLKPLSRRNRRNRLRMSKRNGSKDRPRAPRLQRKGRLRVFHPVNRNELLRKYSRFSLRDRRRPSKPTKPRDRLKALSLFSKDRLRPHIPTRCKGRLRTYNLLSKNIPRAHSRVSSADRRRVRSLAVSKDRTKEVSRAVSKDRSKAVSRAVSNDRTKAVSLAVSNDRSKVVSRVSNKGLFKAVSRDSSVNLPRVSNPSSVLADLSMTKQRQFPQRLRNEGKPFRNPPRSKYKIKNKNQISNNSRNISRSNWMNQDRRERKHRKTSALKSNKGQSPSQSLLPNRLNLRSICRICPPGPRSSMFRSRLQVLPIRLKNQLPRLS